MITLFIPTLRRYDLLAQAVESAADGTAKPSHYHILDNGPGVPAHLRQRMLRAAQSTGATLEIEHHGRNLGVAASWNVALRRHPDWLIISNDDVTFYEPTIARLVEAAENDPEGLFFFPGSGGYKNAWSLFLQRRRSLEVVGEYDEEISPGWGFFEDNDYSYRLALAGYRHIPVPRCAYGHIDSATVKGMTEPERQTLHWPRFQAARERYIAKWGGPPGSEQYQTPYNKLRDQG